MNSLFSRGVLGLASLACLSSAAFAAKPGAPPEDAPALREALTTQVWLWTNPAVPQGTRVHFWKNGAISKITGGPILGAWHLTGAHSLNLQTSATETTPITFSSDFSSFSGNPQIGGHPVGPLGGGVKKHAPVRVPITATASQPRIEVITTQAASISSSIFVPLNGYLPDPGDAITMLREDLLDEAVLNPAASLEAYKTALHLCQAWQSALAERHDRHASYGGTAPVSLDMQGSRKQTLAPGDYARYIAELLQGIAKEQRDADDAARVAESYRKNWADRSALLRQDIDNLSSQLKQLRNTPAPASASGKP